MANNSLDEQTEKAFEEKLIALNQRQKMGNLPSSPQKKTLSSKERRTAELERQFKLTEKTSAGGAVAEEGVSGINQEEQQEQEVQVEERDDEREEEETDGGQNESGQPQEERVEEPDEEQEGNEAVDDQAEDPQEDDEKKDKDKDDEDSDEDEDENSDDEDNKNPDEEEGLGEGTAEGAGELAEGAAAEGAGAAAGTAATAAEGAEAGAAATGLLASTAWLWGPALAILAVLGLVFGIFIFVTITAISYCNADGLSGFGARVISQVNGVVGSGDFCTALQINTNTATVTAPTPPATPPGTGLTDAQARAQLAAAGISVNALEPQTSLAGINSSVIGETIAFKQACGASCNVIVTGGTETTGGHAGGPCSHLSGNKIDIDDNSAVDNYIINSGNFTRIADRGSDRQYRNNNTNVVYARESNHWDIGGIGC